MKATPDTPERDSVLQCGVRTPEGWRRRFRKAHVSLSRRHFLQNSTALLASTTLPAFAAATPSTLIDCNITLGEWPFRNVRPHQRDEHTWREALADRGLTRGWAGSMDGIFRRDLASANAALHRKCARDSKVLLNPVGSINLSLPAWQDDVSRCELEHGMKAIRLHPNYHGYTLDDPRFIELLEAATAKKLLIQIVAQLEDERTQHPLMQVKPVDFKPLSSALQRVPEARVMILNANRAMSMTTLQGCNATLDIAMLEGVGGIENLLKDWPLEKLVFGSHAPLFYFESAKLKLQESELSGAQASAITHENAQRLLAW